MQPLLQTIPKGKIKHSKRVAKSLHKAGVGKVGVYAGLLHDYFERGGDVHTLSQHIDELNLPQRIINVVHALSNDEQAEESSNQPLTHLKAVLQGVEDEGLRNIIILAKLSDRLDNLAKRARRGKISKKYRLKSLELVNWLRYNYTGEEEPIRNLLQEIFEILPGQ
jgi:(p)ppGpp synthase/HD superfamily hydrolase